MKTEIKKEIIIALIKDDIKNTRLVTRLNQLGLEASNYHWNICDVIFKLLGFEDTLQTEETYQYYIEKTQKVSEIDFSETHFSLDNIVLEIFDNLASKKGVQL